MRQLWRWIKTPFRLVKDNLFLPWAEYEEARTYQRAWNEYHQAK